MSDLTISEVKAKIREAEKEILTILEDLQKTTGVVVEKVEICTASLDHIYGKPYRLITGVEIITGSL